MRVNFYATLRPAAGGKTVEVTAAETQSVRAVLHAACLGRPELAEELWDPAGELKSHIRVLVNGRASSFLPQGLETPVTAGDALDVFPPVGGGA